MSGDATRNLEVEVKFYVPDLPALRQRLVEAGSQPIRPRLFERNIRFDTPEERLKARWQLLRLRQDDRVRLTFKGTPDQPTLSEAKVREELEVEVDNFDLMASILTRLGFNPEQVYEKYRETFELDGVEVVLDELPFGTFAELEGEESRLRQTAERLGLRWEQRILENYLTLMEQLKQHHALPFDDLTFANFEDRSLSIKAVLGAKAE